MVPFRRTKKLAVGRGIQLFGSLYRLSGGYDHSSVKCVTFNLEQSLVNSTEGGPQDGKNLRKETHHVICTQGKGPGTRRICDYSCSYRNRRDRCDAFARA